MIVGRKRVTAAGVNTLYKSVNINAISSLDTTFLSPAYFFWNFVDRENKNGSNWGTALNFLHGTQYGQRTVASKVGEHEILLATGKLHKLVWFSHVTPCDILLLFKEPWKIVSAEVNREKNWLADHGGLAYHRPSQTAFSSTASVQLPLITWY